MKRWLHILLRLSCQSLVAVDGCQTQVPHMGVQSIKYEVPLLYFPILYDTLMCPTPPKNTYDQKCGKITDSFFLFTLEVKVKF